MKFLIKLALAGIVTMLGGSMLVFGTSTFDYIQHGLADARAMVLSFVTTETRLDVCEQKLAEVAAAIDDIGGEIARHQVGLDDNERELRSVHERVEAQLAELRLVHAEDKDRLDPDRRDRLERHAADLLAQHQMDLARADALTAQVGNQTEALARLRELRRQMSAQAHQCRLDVEKLRLAQSTREAREELSAPFTMQDNLLRTVQDTLGDIGREHAVEARRLAELRPAESLDDILGRERPDAFARVAELLGEPGTIGDPEGQPKHDRGTVGVMTAGR